MPDRAFSTGYRFGFNGMEKDDEVKGAGNSLDFGARVYDSRLGRWLSLDPLQDKYPDLSPYNFCRNNPAVFIDPDGRKIFIYYNTGEKDDDGKEIIKAYEYGSGIKPPKVKFVKQTIRTLNKIVHRGYDKKEIIKTLAKDEDYHVAISQDDDPFSSAAIVEVGSAKIVAMNGQPLENIDEMKREMPDVISWGTDKGLISPDGKETQSAANGLLHELAHKYYSAYDPEGKLKDSGNDGFYEKQSIEVGEFHTYADKWIIENVETGFKGEWKRKNHSEGFFLKTQGGPMSKRGTEYGRWGKVGAVKDLKNGNAIKND